MCECMLSDTDSGFVRVPLTCSTNADLLWLRAQRVALEYCGRVHAIAPCLLALSSSVWSEADDDARRQLSAA